MFGIFELENAPYNGDGMFYGNSRLKFADVTDGLSNTLMKTLAAITPEASTSCAPTCRSRLSPTIST